MIGVIGWFWLDSARARELATGVAESLCERRSLQFLDETVSLQRIALRRTGDGLRLRRMFGFDFSIEGVGRRRGHVILLGTRVEQFSLDLPPEPVPGHATAPLQPEPPPVDPAAADHECKVIPFRRPPRRD